MKSNFSSLILLISLCTSQSLLANKIQGVIHGGGHDSDLNPVEWHSYDSETISKCRDVINQGSFSELAKEDRALANICSEIFPHLDLNTGLGSAGGTVP